MKFIFWSTLMTIILIVVFYFLFESTFLVQEKQEDRQCMEAGFTQQQCDYLQRH